MIMEKVTRKSVLTKAVAMDVFSEEEIEVLNKMIASLDKKSTSGKDSAKKAENRQFGDQIIEYLRTVDKASASEIGKHIGNRDFTSQKVMGIIKSAGISDRLEKVVEKGKSYYKLAETQAE